MRGSHLFLLTSFQSQTDPATRRSRRIATPPASLILRSRIASAWGAVVATLSLALRSFLVCSPFSVSAALGRRHFLKTCSLRLSTLSEQVLLNKATNLCHLDHVCSTLSSLTSHYIDLAWKMPNATKSKNKLKSYSFLNIIP